MRVEEALDITIEQGEGFSEEEIYAQYTEDVLWTGTGDKRKPNETNFARLFRDINMLKFINGTFYTKDGMVSKEYISHEIWASLADAGMSSGTKRAVENTLAACAYCATVPSFTVDENIVPFRNGNYYVNERVFKHEEITTVPYRLSVDFRAIVPEIPYFKKWLSDLFEPDDILTLQEYLGYCLVPTTRVQKALFLVGEGGAGKSGIGVILQSILGNAVINVPNTKEFLENRFMLAELENKLVLYDDDLDSSALSSTGLYKKLITNTLSVTADKKYGPTYKFSPQVKLIACANEMLTSAFDKTGGFYRRLLPLIVKPIRKDFEPDLSFYDHLKAEAEGIALWAVAGLNRLVYLDWKIHESDRTKQFMLAKQNEENPLPLFLESNFYFDPAIQDGVHTKKIIEIYREWCTRNAFTPWKDRAVQKWLSSNAEKYGITFSEHVVVDGQRARGYRGLRVKESPNSSPQKGIRIHLI